MPTVQLLKTLTLLLITVLFSRKLCDGSRYSWMWYDHYDELADHMNTVDGQNCKSKAREDLVLRPDTLSQIPVYNRLLNRIWYRNRTALIHLHNMALNRAFFYSYILQKMNDSASFYIQPNWLYMYMSAVADVNANPKVLNGSALYFDTDTHYPNWYQTVPFNNTLKLFGPKAWRIDDTQDQGNFLREPTRRTTVVADVGAGRVSNYTDPTFKMNPWYSKWLPDLEGDLDSLTKFTHYVGIKYSNQTGKFLKDEFESFPFFGPPSPSAQEDDERMLPVVFTQPYYDCGRYDNWVVSAVSPVVDYMPRYSNWTHLRRQRSVAVVVMDTSFKKIDFNACGVSAGNPGPSYLSGIHRCRPTTNCKHKMGYGFKRGGYSCPCKSGTRYPWNEQPPWDGDLIEQATDTEYYNSFQCTPSDFRQVLPKVDQTEAVSIVGGSNTLTYKGEDIGVNFIQQLVSSDFRTRKLLRTGDTNVNHTSNTLSLQGSSSERGDKDLRDAQGETASKQGQPIHSPHGVHADTFASHDRKPRYQDQVEAAHQRRLQATGSKRGDNRNEFHNKTEQIRRKRSTAFDARAFNRMMQIFRLKDSVTGRNCHQVAPHNLVMGGDVTYGVKTQFESEARTALRLSHFLCNFLQNTDASENFGNLRGGGRLHQEHMFGEVVANVMGNFKIYSAGVFFDRYQWENQDGSKMELFGPWAYRRQGVVNAMDSAGLTTMYTGEDWFRTVKARWATNTVGLKVYKMKAWIRSDSKGTSSIKHEHYPLRYRAPEYTSGHWTRPHFRCDGKVDAWVITYVTPFFGLDKFKRKLEFRGVVTVDVPLNLLELNPCPMGFGVANAFKNTARCDPFSTKCSPIAGYPFVRGAYSCKCRAGFEYPHLDGREWFQGSLVESEYEKKVRGMFSRFDQLKCRVASSPSVISSTTLLLAALVVFMVTIRHY
ncbi:uncharacterized protein [Littorina saxatilis]|uniref:GPR158/179 extracellular domain-containing protein n=1 Tax=Littorina saxatilis TaxID=31220 RepID=A0AAN9GMN4_9CAEN